MSRTKFPAVNTNNGQIGQRTDVLVTGTGNPDGKYWMRSNISNTLVPSQHTNCSRTNQPFALAAIFYEEANRTLSPDSIAWEDNGDIAANCSNVRRTGIRTCY